MVKAAFVETESADMCLPRQNYELLVFVRQFYEEVKTILFGRDAIILSTH